MSVGIASVSIEARPYDSEHYSKTRTTYTHSHNVATKCLLSTIIIIIITTSKLSTLQDPKIQTLGVGGHWPGFVTSLVVLSSATDCQVKWTYSKTGLPINRPYPRRLESPTINRCQSKGSKFSSVNLRPWVFVRPGIERSSMVATKIQRNTILTELMKYWFWNRPLAAAYSSSSSSFHVENGAIDPSPPSNSVSHRLLWRRNWGIRLFRFILIRMYHSFLTDE